MKLLNSKTLVAGLAIAAMALPILALSHSSKPEHAEKQAVATPQGAGETVVAYPWVFQNGTETARNTAMTTAEEIGTKAGFTVVPKNIARTAWRNEDFPAKSFDQLPTPETLEAYGLYLHATKVIYGSVSWNTRSIWVDLGPKTISTATVDAYVFDVKANKVVFQSVGTAGRSDDSEAVWKVAADVLISPLFTVVSGGPATPKEQRAVQIALGTAYHPWVKFGDASR